MSEFFFRPEAYVFHALIILGVIVAGLIIVTLVSRYIYERRQKRSEVLKVKLGKMLFEVGRAESQQEAEDILKACLKKARGPYRPVFLQLLKEAPQPKRSEYFEYIAGHLGRNPLARQATSGSSRWKRIEAIEILSEIRNSGNTEVLIQCLEDEDEDVLYAAVRALARRKDMRAAGAALGLLGSGKVHDRRLVAMLEEFPLSIDELVWPLLEDPRPKMRFWAARLLETSKEPETARRLVKLAGDDDPDVRSGAIQSLAHMGSPEVLKAISGAIEDPEWFVRAQAAKAVGTLKAVELHEQVICLLWDKHWWVRQNTKMTLLSFCPDIEETLIQFLLVEDQFARNMVAEVLAVSGAVERHGKELEREPDGARQQMFFRAIAGAGGDSSIRGWMDKTTPEARKVLEEILTSEMPER
jgi:HEAT repeat protein